jgi:hypothetical protein
MVRTSTAEDNNYLCPACEDQLTRDKSGKGFVAHVSNRDCDFEKGMQDSAAPTHRVGHRSKHAPPGQEPTDGVRVCGYSERGIFNVLFYEIGFSRDPIGTLERLLSLTRFSDGPRAFSGLQGADVLVEQSLSDFGDADTILLLHGSGWRRVVFIEGKVKPAQVGSRSALGALAGISGAEEREARLLESVHSARSQGAARLGMEDRRQSRGSTGCADDRAPSTLRVFDFNRGQIH